MKNLLYQNGQILGLVGERILQDEILEKIKILQDLTTEYISLKVQDFEQLNAANGIYDDSPEKKEFIINWIKKCRDFYLLKKNLILKASSIQELDNIRIDDFSY